MNSYLFILFSNIIKKINLNYIYLGDKLNLILSNIFIFFKVM